MRFAGPLEKAPAGLGQNRFVSVPLHASGFGGADVVESLVHLGHDVEPVEDIECLGTLLADHAQIRFPHKWQTLTRRIEAPCCKTCEKAVMDAIGRKAVRRILIPELLELNRVPTDRTAKYHVRYGHEESDVLASRFPASRQE